MNLKNHQISKFSITHTIYLIWEGGEGRCTYEHYRILEFEQDYTVLRHTTR